MKETKQGDLIEITDFRKGISGNLSDGKSITCRGNSRRCRRNALSRVSRERPALSEHSEHGERAVGNESLGASRVGPGRTGNASRWEASHRPVSQQEVT